MTIQKRAAALISMLFAIAMFSMGCSKDAKPAKSATGVGTQGSESPPPQPAPTAASSDAPPPPQPAPAVNSSKMFVIELDAAGRPLVDGETIEVK